MNKVFNKIFVKNVDKIHCIQFFYVLRPFCYPLKEGDVKTEFFTSPFLR